MSAPPQPASREDRSLAFDLAMAGVCSVLFAWVLSQAFAAPEDLRASSEPTIGAVDDRRNDVRRRPSGRLTWQDVERGHAIHDSDAVYAAEDSEAVIRLDDGTVITLDERSLVVLRRRRAEGSERPRLAVELVRGGTRSITTRDGVELIAGGTRIKARSGSTLRVRSSEAGAAVEVAHGGATVSSGAQAGIALNQSERLELAGDQTRRTALTVELQQPSDAAVVFVRATTPKVAFSWNAPTGAKDCEWQLAATGDFERTAAQVKSASGTVEVAAPAEGLYHWRVRCGAHESEQRTVRVKLDLPPVLYAPRAEELVDLSGDKQVAVAWSELRDEAKYQVEIARDGQFSQSEVAFIAERPSARLNLAVAEGRYCLRVRAESRAEAPWSQPTCFRAIRQPILDAPRLYEPVRETLPPPNPGQQGLRLLRDLLLPTAYAANPRSALVLRWDRIPAATSYVLEIAEDRKFSRVVVRETVSDPYYRWNVVVRRDYFWRVRAIDAAGREGKHSEILKIGSEIAPPQLSWPQANGRLEVAGPQGVTLRWQGTAVLAAFRVEVASDPAFTTDVVVADVREPKWTLAPLRLGTHYWRVTGVDLDGLTTDASEVRRFTTVPTAPEPSGPSKVVAAATQTAVRLSWSTRPVARYQVELAPERGAVVSLVTPHDGVEVPVPGAGRFSWRVRGLEPETSWSPPRTLEVAIAPPSPRFPADGAEVLSAEEAVLRWENVPLADLYEIALETADGAPPRTERVTGTELVLGALPAGKYAWTVRAVASGGGLTSEASSRVAFAVVTPPSFEVGRPAQVEATSAPLAPSSLRPAPRAVISERPRTLSVTALSGVTTNFGAVTSPYLGAEAHWRMAHPWLRWGVSARATAYGARQRVGQGRMRIDSELVAIPLELTATTFWPLGPVELVGSAGPVFRFVAGTVEFPGGDELNQGSLELGATARAGVQLRWGPGLLYGETALTLSTTTDGLVRTGPGALALGAGYRWELW